MIIATPICFMNNPLSRIQWSVLLTTFAILLLLVLPSVVFSQGDQSKLALADTLFRAAEFSQAEALYEDTLKNEPGNYRATLQLGRIALLGNRFADAERWLKKAIELKPEENEPKALLAEAYYRQDNFKEAAPLFQAIGKTPMADKLQYFSNKVPYQIESGVDVTSVEFVQTDPLPIVKIRLNNIEETLFLIDTGGWELIIDTDLAEKIGAKKFGGDTAVYAGGTKAITYHGMVDQVKIGDFLVKNVPVSINESTKRIADAFGIPVRGVLGTVFLYHFIFTLDYPNGRLILQRKTEENVKQMKRLVESKDNIVVPFWMAGDHFIIAKGTVNGSKPLLFHLDTGMAGGGFDCPESVIKEANIELSKETKEGMGGGGMIKIKEGLVRELTLGKAKEHNIRGLFGGFPPVMEYRFGFRLGGVISHAFFRTYQLTFDFTTMNVVLERG